MAATARTAFPPLPTPLLPQVGAAERHVAALLRCAGTDPLPTARASASYQIAMLALGHHERLTPHCAAFTGCHLLYLAAAVRRATGIAPREPLWHDGTVDPRALERDAGIIGAQGQPLTQAAISTALAHYRQAVAARGVDLGRAIQDELAGASARPPALPPEIAAALPPPFIVASLQGRLRRGAR